MYEKLYSKLNMLGDRNNIEKLYIKFVNEMVEIQKMLFDLDRIQINKIANTDELKCLTEIINYFDDNDSDIIWDKMNESSSTKDSTYLNKLISIITNESLVAELKNRLEANKEC